MNLHASDNDKVKEISEMIIALERNALEKWNHGDPSAYLALYADDFTYFDPMLEKRLDGYEAIYKIYKEIEGQIHVSKYEMINPRVQVCLDSAVLTYNLNSWLVNGVSKWNCTEVYRKQPDGSWNIIHNHWSMVQPHK